MMSKLVGTGTRLISKLGLAKRNKTIAQNTIISAMFKLVSADR